MSEVMRRCRLCTALVDKHPLAERLSARYGGTYVHTQATTCYQFTLVEGMTEVVNPEETEATQRIVKMWDLVKALAANGIHAADCPAEHDCHRKNCGVFHVIDRTCSCWCDPETKLRLVVNG